jgi:GH24 family phage-related lysozyme (muramidase)
MATAADILRREEVFRSTPYWDVNAYRVGYGSDTYMTADGQVRKVTKGITINKDDAERDLQRRIGEFQGGIQRTIGPQNWQRLTPAAQAALTSVAYNYGSLGKLPNLVRAAKSGDPSAIASGIRQLRANPARRAREALAITGGGGYAKSGQDTAYASAVMGSQYGASAAPAVPYVPPAPVQNDAITTLQSGMIKATANDLYQPPDVRPTAGVRFFEPDYKSLNAAVKQWSTF